MERILHKIDMKKFFNHLKEGRTIIGPRKMGGGTARYTNTAFGELQAIEDADLCYQSTMLTLKSVLFPDNQSLYEFVKDENGVSLKNMRSVFEKEMVLLGIHPCDIASIACLDKVFSEDNLADSYYNKRREKTIVIGLTCEKSQPTCFCQAVGSGPDAETGFDLLMTDLGDRYFIKSGTKIGEKLLDPDMFILATEADVETRTRKLEAVSKMLPESNSLENLTHHIAGKFDSDEWENIAEDCCSCGACNMVCPTCHCFTIRDKANLDLTKGRRVLVWDACHFERFASMAGNYTIREGKETRYKHRLYDKFYYDPQRYGSIFCVGCGRCITYCPAHINIITKLDELREKE
jgi:sulfhydrogenase subunit beta (sulfur reductase)